jgi:hypothetical protein
MDDNIYDRDELIVLVNSGRITKYEACDMCIQREEDEKGDCIYTNSCPVLR